ncbi:hypothetical protein C1I98_24665 [Spongiactinospora gelatinilytica]|uniref:Helix-turn-helix domain-containing protein n=1 Tax=Spongiactinospora gelatinilytica TaxID=2666298 RepID=A0A2W2FQU1_9ACTN|nr:hypothetical protein C1I98_24665 [Spongiactinospora gelatinilytica]
MMLDLITTTDFARLLGVSATVARTIVREGEVAHYRLGRQSVRIPRAEAERYSASFQGRRHAAAAAERALSSPRGWLTIPQAAQLMTVSERTIITLLADGLLRAEVIDGVRHIALNEIGEYLTATYVPAKAA